MSSATRRKMNAVERELHETALAAPNAVCLNTQLRLIGADMVN